MHTTVHYASGLILASICHALLEFNFWVFACVVASPLIPDIDIVFSKFAKDHNHRLLFTHSLYPPFIILLIGFITQNSWILICGVGYLLHLSFDLIDWGTNIFFTGKLYGLKKLLNPQERKTYNLQEFKIGKDPWFFFDRYYTSAITILFEIVCPLIGTILLFFYAVEYWYFIFGYITVFIFHLTLYLESQRLKQGKELRIRAYKIILH